MVGIRRLDRRRRHEADTDHGGGNQARGRQTYRSFHRRQWQNRRADPDPNRWRESESFRFLELDGGEHLRWKLEWKDGKLAGSFSAQHDNPKKWMYDRVLDLTMTRVQ